MQDKGKFRLNDKDQFYTKEIVAKQCIDTILKTLPETSDYFWVESSAGSGSFYNNLPGEFDKFGMDIDPKSKLIKKANFLEWNYCPATTKKNVIVFGNPPFGRQSSLAKAFIKKSCMFADVIAFILPRSFTKPSMFGVFDLKFHCLLSVELEKDSFLLNDSDYNVQCVFQIWQKQSSDRLVEKKIEAHGYKYVSKTSDYHVAVRRVGVYAGKSFIRSDVEYSPSSHYFLVFNQEKHIDEIVKAINSHVFPSNTLGPRSLSKSEINLVVNNIILKIVS